MQLTKTTSYAPDIARALNGILLIHKPASLHPRQLVREVRERIADSLNEYQPRPLAQRLQILGGLEEQKQLVHVPDYSDHPLVVGPRYLPWEVKITPIRPLGTRGSGISVMLLGNANHYYKKKMERATLVSIYHISARFGHITHNCFSDGKIQDKLNYHHIRTGKMDATLARIESTQQQRLFDATKLPRHSQEAYEAALAWPLRPAHMATWPVIYRLRCIHLQLPEFKLEVVVVNETESFLAQLVHDVGFMLKSGAYTESIRRVKFGPFSVDDCLTDKEWDLQSMVNQAAKHHNMRAEIHQLLRDSSKQAIKVKTQYHVKPEGSAGPISSRA